MFIVEDIESTTHVLFTGSTNSILRPSPVPNVFRQFLFPPLATLFQLVFWILDKSGYFVEIGVSEYHISIIQTLCMMPSWLNYSCNFFIYTLANASFRKDLKLVLTSWRSCLPGSRAAARGGNDYSQSTGMSSLSDSHPLTNTQASTTDGK